MNKQLLFNKEQGSTLLFVIFGALIIALAAGAFFWMSMKTTSAPIVKTQISSPAPTNAANPTATTSAQGSWKRVSENDYSFEIPSGWVLPSNSSEYSNLDPAKISDSDKNKDYVKFSVSSEQTTQSLSDYVKSQMQLPQIKAYGGANFSTQNLTVNSQSAVRFIMGTPPQFVYVKNPNKPVILSLNFFFDVDKYAEIYNHILSSFKFTK